ncbi:MAG: PilZ domain-containing protein [Desulfobacteria bacterium]
MTDTAEVVEQRRYKRYEVPTDSFVALGPQNSILGQIIDVSMGGLAFRFMDSKKPTDKSYLDIFLTERDFCLGKVPVKAVSDYEIDNTVTCKLVEGVYRCTAMRRSSVQFGELTHHQMSQLEHFIQNHTTSEL